MGYLHNRGDYGRYRGDPGILDVFRRIAGTALGVVGSLAPGPAGAIMRKAATVVRPARPVARPAPVGFMPGMPAMEQMPALPGIVTVDPITGRVKRPRRRMNVTNAKALRRAIRRTDGFVKLAKRSLKGTGYTVSRRGSTRRGPATIVETGPGSVHTR